MTLLLVAALGCDRKSSGESPTMLAPPTASPTSGAIAAPATNDSPRRALGASGGASGGSAGDDLSPAVPPEPKTRRRYVVAALGDSITDVQAAGGGYLRVLEKACPESRFLNFGRGGDMVNQMRRRFERDIVPRIEPDGMTTLLVYGGVNDLYSDLTAGRKNDAIQQDLVRIYERAHALGLEVVAVTVSPWGGFTRYYNERRGQNTRLLNSWILGQVAEGRVDVAVDSYSLLSCGNDEKLCPEMQPPFSDGLHVGKKGHRLLGEKLEDLAFSDCR